MLENNIQMALQQQNIELEDAIDLREIKNVKLANQLLKIRRKKKEEKDQMVQQQNIQAQGEANAKQAEAAALAEVEKQDALNKSEAELEEIKSQLDVRKLMQEANIKKELMAFEFQLNMQLKQMEVEALKSKEAEKEDRKDKRTKIQATQQSELIDQRTNQKPPKNFESAGNDTLTGGFDLGAFDPR